MQSDGTLTVTVAGSTTQVTGVKAFASVCPSPGHGVWLATDGTDLMAIGTIGPPTTPPGIVDMWGGQMTAIPAGWLLCDGSAVSRTTFTGLFAAIGTTFGPGDGSTTFNLPSSRDRFPVGAGSAYAVGATGGEASHTLTAAEIPAHTHGVPVPDTAVDAASGSARPRPSGTRTNTSDGGTGGGGAHNNLPPYLGFALIIKT